MKNSEMENELKLLSKIESVEAPPFLFTRIQQRIQEISENKITLRMVRVISFSLVLLISINALAWIKLSHEKKSKANLAQQLQLLPENSFYHE
mgnify:CR=1 FL=1